jgi:hypoxanthine phosphoribosyltransferase
VHVYTGAPTSVLLSAQQIAAKVAQLGARITADHAGSDEPLVVVPVLKGSLVFAADLLRAIDLPLVVEPLAVQSYGAATKSSGVVRITLDLATPIAGRDVLLVEDIVDTGLTCAFLVEHLAASGARSVKVCALLHKPARAVKDVAIDYLGFTIPDVFVVGYGLDADQLHRNLPDVRVLE